MKVKDEGIIDLKISPKSPGNVQNKTHTGQFFLKYSVGFCFCFVFWIFAVTQKIVFTFSQFPPPNHIDWKRKWRNPQLTIFI